MKRTALATLVLVLPAAALALDFRHGDDGYSDASRLSVAERAAVSVLTEVGAVQGNPDGSFAPQRTLNRAEFSKIALLSSRGDPREDLDVNCFPDVREEHWYSTYVCWAKDEGAVQGNPDGLFHPSRPVNYAEAVKILVELAGYDLPEPPENERWAWYRAYLLAAEERGVALPGGVDPGHELTRGQMARLAAAFVAHRSGELEAYRAAERGEFESSASSSSRSSSVSSVATTSSSSSVAISSSASSSSSAKASLFPAKNSFLLTGERTPLILGGTVVSEDEASTLEIVRLTLRREIAAIQYVYLVDQYGGVIAELIPSTDNNSDRRKWEARVPDSSYTFGVNAPTKVGVVFDLHPMHGGGASNLLVETELFQIQTEGVGTGNTKYLLPDVQVYPVHQTAFGRITSALSALPSSGTLPSGASRQIASLHIEGDVATGGTIRVRGLDLIASVADVTMSNVKIGDASKNAFADCGIEKLEQLFISCGSLPEALSGIPAGGLTVSVYADLALTGSKNGQVVVSYDGRGHIGKRGALSWGDGTSTFTWVEEGVPYGGNTTWTVTK